MPEGAGGLAPGDSGAPRFSRTPRPGRPVVLDGAFLCASRPAAGQRLRWFLPGKKPPPAPRQVSPRRPRLCGFAATGQRAQNVYGKGREKDLKSENVWIHLARKMNMRRVSEKLAVFQGKRKGNA